MARSERWEGVPKVECPSCGSSDMFTGRNPFRFALCRRCGYYWKPSGAGAKGGVR